MSVDIEGKLIRLRENPKVWGIISIVSFFAAMMNIVYGFLIFTFNWAFLAVLIIASSVIIISLRDTPYFYYIKRDHTSIELMDKEGSSAKFARELDLIANRDDIDKYQITMRTDGNTANPSPDSGLVTRWNELGEDHFKVQLPTTLRKGEKRTCYFTLELIDCFKEQVEYWSAIIVRKTGELEMKITFPIDRPPKAWNCYDQIGDTEELYKKPHMQNIPDSKGRQVLIWTIKKPKIGHRYKLRWTW